MFQEYLAKHDEGYDISFVPDVIVDLILTQKDAEVAEERKRIENDVLAPLYEKIDGWYKERHDIVGQGALASVFEEALKALTPHPTEDTSDKT